VLSTAKGTTQSGGEGRGRVPKKTVWDKKRERKTREASKKGKKASESKGDRDGKSGGGQGTIYPGKGRPPQRLTKKVLLRVDGELESRHHH